MAERLLKLIITRCKQGHSLGQLSELTGLTIDQVKEKLGLATGLTPEELNIIFNMKQEGKSLEQISQEFEVELDILKQFLTDSEETSPVIKETFVGLETQIEELLSQGKRDQEIARILGINVEAVVAYGLQGECKTYYSEATEQAPINFRQGEQTRQQEQATKNYTLGSPDEGVSLTRKASEPAPVYHRTPEEAKQPQRPHPTQTQPQHSPTFFYSCQKDTNQLQRVNLLTGEHSKHEVPHYQFNACCRWSELPGGSLLITGGYCGGPSRDVVRVDVGTFAVSPQPPMHTARAGHAAVYHSQYVYVLGGWDYRYLSECERYVCAESRWEVLAALPVGGFGMSAVELQNSLYALGGNQGRDTVQKLSLDSLTWQLMQLKLPQAACDFPCFKKDTEVYFVSAETLYSFTPLEVKPIKTLPEGIRCISSYYSRGTLYYDKYGYGIGSTRLERHSEQTRQEEHIRQEQQTRQEEHIRQEQQTRQEEHIRQEQQTRQEEHIRQEQQTRQEEHIRQEQQTRQEQQARFKEQASECRAQGESQLADLYDQAASQLLTTDQLATISNKIGLLYSDKGDITRAEEYYLKCLSIWQEVLRPNHPNLATIYNNLGSLYNSKGDSTRAEEFYLKCLSIRQEVLPANHPHLASICNNLGLLYESKGDSTRAEEHFLECLSIAQEVLPANHPNLATIYNSLGVLYKSKGDSRRAEDYLWKCCFIRLEILPANHLDLAKIYDDLGDLSKSTGNSTRAEMFYLKCLSIRQEILPANHPKLALIYSNLGSLYKSKGDSTRAEEFYLKCLSIRQEVLPTNHPDLAATYNSLGDLYYGNGDSRRAKQYLLQCLSIRQEILPANDPKLASTYNILGVLYQKEKDYPGAMKYLMKCLSIRQEVLPANQDLADTYSYLGALHYAIGDSIGGREYFRLSKLTESLL
jgi:tetratricopeptide (TPR) repeat protein